MKYRCELRGLEVDLELAFRGALYSGVLLTKIQTSLCMSPTMLDKARKAPPANLFA